MNDLAVFNFDNNLITATIYEGKPAFVAMDVARALGYATPQKAIKDHCKSLIKIKCSEMEHLGFVPIPQGRSGGYVYDKDGTYINPKTGEEMYTSKVQLTNAGARKMYREYLKLNLPMKKSWNGEFSNSPFRD